LHPQIAGAQFAGGASLHPQIAGAQFAGGASAAATTVVKVGIVAWVGTQTQRVTSNAFTATPLKNVLIRDMEKLLNRDDKKLSKVYSLSTTKSINP
jgi:hypothetical protein